MTASPPKVGAIAAPATALLTVENLFVNLRGPNGITPLVKGVSFTLTKGETLAIAGESGSGKSITSLALMGLLPAPAVFLGQGEMRLGNLDLATLSDRQMNDIRGSRIAMIFQDPMTSLNPVMKIGMQLIEAIKTHLGSANSDATEMALRALRAVKITLPEQRMGQYPHELSGGMRQRVMIAMALALKPQILIADEPTTALDVTVQREILDLLRDLKSEFGTAIILITHDMGVVAEMADRVLIMRHGEIVEQGSVRDIFHRPTHSYTQSLLAAVPKIGHGTRQRPLTSDQDEIVAEVRNISVKYTTGQSFWGGAHKIFHAVSDVSFQIKRGETLALVGESGCGKSTVAKALVGLTPFEGSINIGGKSFAQCTKAAAKALRKKVQIVFQDPMAALDPRMMVKALIAEPLVIHNIGTPASRQAEVLDLVLKVGLLEEHLDRYPHEFSGGQRQRICIARALALKPDLIVADEAVSALDVSVQATVLDLLTSLQKEFGIAILFISHDLAVVENICDRVAVMHHGVIVETGTREQIFFDPQHSYTQKLLAAVPVPDPDYRQAAAKKAQL